MSDSEIIPTDHTISSRERHVDPGGEAHLRDLTPATITLAFAEYATAIDLQICMAGAATRA